MLAHRIADRRVLRLIERWLGAGVLEGGQWKAAETGTPQGSGISPILANLFLHYVVDLWVHQWRQRRAGGQIVIVRYADDSVPRRHRRERQCRTAREMRVGPSEPAVRSRLQTTTSCDGKEPPW
jgi:retron-type reverse transcriptase